VPPDERVHAEQMRLSNGLVVVSNRRTPVHAMFDEVFRSEAYTPADMPPVPAGGIVVDIGASVGMYTLMAATRWPHAAVHAVEPAPDTYELLLQNVKANGFDDRVTCHQLAITRKSGTAVLSLAATSACDSLLPLPADGTTDNVVVRTRSLDDLFRLLPPSGRVHLKVDAEGSEFEIFESASPAALARIAFLVFECHEYKADAARTAALVERLEGAGLTLRYVRTASELIVFGLR
jgi:FkbM family methyltransferase